MCKKKGKKGIFTEFKEFITKGNVLDMAVGVIIGNAFRAIVTALTDRIIMPLITFVVGNNTFSDIKTVLRQKVENRNAEGVLEVVQEEIAISWGALIQASLDFLIIALVLFVIIKSAIKFNEKRLALAEKLVKKKKEEEEAEPEEPAKPSIEEQNAEVLKEIRDLLKDKNK